MKSERRFFVLVMAAVIMAGGGVRAGAAEQGSVTQSVDAVMDESIADVLENVDSIDELTFAMEEADMVDMETVGTENHDGTQAEPYSLRRITLFADDVTQSYGASSVVCYDKYDYYVFGFDTESATEAAYYQMVDDYGADRCTLDQMMYADDLLSDYSDEDTYDAVGWERHTWAWTSSNLQFQNTMWSLRLMWRFLIPGSIRQMHCLPAG